MHVAATTTVSLECKRIVRPSTALECTACTVELFLPLPIRTCGLAVISP